MHRIVAPNKNFQVTAPTAQPLKLALCLPNQRNTNASGVKKKILKHLERK